MSSGRRSKQIKMRERTVIFCEGETEKNYFDKLKRKYNALNVDAINMKIDVEVPGGHSLELVNKAIRKLEYHKDYKDNKKLKKIVIFDKDEVDFNMINEAIKLAEKNNIKVVFSNECFDYWLLLHYEKQTGHINRKDIYKKLARHLNIDSYESKKADNKMIESFVDKVNKAQENADFSDISPESIKQNPYTNMSQGLEYIFNRTKF